MDGTHGDAGGGGDDGGGGGDGGDGGGGGGTATPSQLMVTTKLYQVRVIIFLNYTRTCGH